MRGRPHVHLEVDQVAILSQQEVPNEVSVYFFQRSILQRAIKFIFDHFLVHELCLFG